MAQTPDNGNPVVAEIDQAHANLSEPAKQAISILGSNASTPAPTPGLLSPAIAATGSPMAGIKPALPPAPSLMSPAVPATPPQSTMTAPAAHQAELARLTTGDTGKPGVSQIHNPILRGIAHAGDIAESLFFPAAAAFTPGTTMNHQRLVHNARADVVADDESRIRNAQAAEQESLPELHQQQVENVADKNEAQREIAAARNEYLQSEHDRKVDADKNRVQSTLAQHGFKLDLQGNVIPLPYEEMSQEQQSVHDLKASQQEVADATASLRKAQKDNIPKAQQLAQQRIDVAMKNAEIARDRLGLSTAQFDLKKGGADESQALPGQLVDDSNRTIGTAFQGNLKPTAQQRNKADLAHSADEQIATMKEIIQKHPDIFGPGKGRITDIETWLGSQDPDASRFRTARTLAADHSAGVFGGRSETALNELNRALGMFHDNPQAAMAGLEGFGKANTLFRNAGTPHTAGSSTPQRPAGVPANATWNAKTRHWEAP